MNRAEVTFLSAGKRCAAWLYRPPSGGGDVPCVVMAHGVGLTRHDRLSSYAEALAKAGAAVLVYDHRYLGDSEGEPRQRVRLSEQLDDRLAAIRFARTLDGIDPDRVIVWGYSLSGGTAMQAAVADEHVAGAILLCPLLDGRWRTIHGMRMQPRNAIWVTRRAMQDALVPVTAVPGDHGALAFPGEFEGFLATAAPGWRNEVHAGVALPLPFWRPVAHARKLACPVLIQAGIYDVSVSARAIDQLAHTAGHARALQRRPLRTVLQQPFGRDHGGPSRLAQITSPRVNLTTRHAQSAWPDSDSAQKKFKARCLRWWR